MSVVPAYQRVSRVSGALCGQWAGMATRISMLTGCGMFALGWYLGAQRVRGASQLPRGNATGNERRAKEDGDDDGEEESWQEDIDLEGMDCKDLPLRRLRKAEAVILRRTSRITVVLERTTYAHNYSAVMRTAEALGVQNVWVIKPPREDDPMAAGVSRHQNRRKDKDTGADDEEESHAAFAKRAVRHLWIREFETTAACVAAIHVEGRALWVTDLSQTAESLYSPALSAKRGGLPSKIALAFGTESTGASPTLLRAADKHSLNLSVAAAMIIQRVFTMCGPGVVGDMDERDRRKLREEWYPKLAKTPEQKVEYARLIDNPPPPLSDLRVVNEERRKPRKHTLAKQNNLGDAFEVGIGH